MNKISQNRIFLIRALSQALTETVSTSNELQLSEIDALIEIFTLVKQDDKGHYLSARGFYFETPPAGYSVTITYSKSEDDTFVEERRVMTSLGRYISKYYTEQYNKISPEVLDKFVRRCIFQHEAIIFEFSSKN